MNILKEHMSYIIIKAKESGISPDDLESVWKNSISQQKMETPNLSDSDPNFTKKVMDRFDNKVNMINIEKARSVVMAREDSVRHGQKWIDSLAQNNYVDASEHFPNFVKSAYDSIIEVKSKEFINKFSEKLRKDNK